MACWRYAQVGKLKFVGWPNVLEREGQMPGNDGQRRLLILSAWKRWFILFTPLMAFILAASIWLDFKLIMIALIAVLTVTLLYQRHINRRSWRSIMWGVHASTD